MKQTLLALLLGTSTLPAGTLILTDNFNAPDNTNFDNSDQTNRRGGILGPDVQLRSSRIQHGIQGNELNFLKPASGSGRIRFQQVASLPTNVWTDFAAGVAGSTILAEGGLRISFDWTPANNTSGDWISFSSGIAGIAVAEPEMRLNHAATDFGFLLRNNGQTQYFDNSVAATGTNFPVSAVATRKVVFTLAFGSFADGSNVGAKVTVDGVSVLPAGHTFQWDGNAGILNMEMGNYVAGTRIDNFSMSGLNGILASLSAPPFYSSILNNGTVGTLSSAVNEIAEPATYTLVAGDGDFDNGKFKIAGDQLQSNGYNFIGSHDNMAFSVRVRATGVNSGLSTEQVFLVTAVADDDSDDLPDTWEYNIAFNLSDLKGRNPGVGPGAGTGDFDGDGLTDLQEYQLSIGLYPLLSPILEDTDGDGLRDGAELNPTGTRVVTNPTLADTDGDGLSDQVENNSGIFAGNGSPGTNATDYDTDDDSFPDGYEIIRGTSPLDAGAVPGLPAPLTTVELTTDETSGINADKIYTHALSGGYGATINGVALVPLKPNPTVPDLTWNAFTHLNATAGYNEIATATLGEWLPVNGGVTGPGLLEMFSGFAYSGNGDQRGARQTYTLTNLTPGERYELRLYTRVWSKVASGRPISMTFENGAQSVNAYVLADRPAIMLGNNNPDAAYALVFPYTAESTELTITAAVPLSTLQISGSWHMYGLTNEALPPASDDSFVISSLTLQQTPTPSATLTFTSTPGAVYAVDYSTEMKATGQAGGWTPLVNNLASQGTSTTYTDTVGAGSGPRVFYRVRRLP